MKEEWLIVISEECNEYSLLRKFFGNEQDVRTYIANIVKQYKKEDIKENINDYKVGSDTPEEVDEFEYEDMDNEKNVKEKFKILRGCIFFKESESYIYTAIRLKDLDKISFINKN